MNHHAYFYAGDREEGISTALTFGERGLGLSGSANPDIITLRHDLFSVEDARGVINIVHRTSTTGTKLIIIATHRIFHEAQNALLKVFEEPPPGTYLVLIVPTEGNIIPTLRSRLLPLEQRISTASNKVAGSMAEEFIKAGKEGRGKIVAKILDKAKSDKPEEKQAARIEALAFAEGLVRAAHIENVHQKDSELIAFLGDLSHFIPILHERSAPLKPILEHILITIPQDLGKRA